MTREQIPNSAMSHQYVSFYYANDWLLGVQGPETASESKTKKQIKKRVWKRAQQEEKNSPLTREHFNDLTLLVARVLSIYDTAKLAGSVAFDVKGTMQDKSFNAFSRELEHILSFYYSLAADQDGQSGAKHSDSCLDAVVGVAVQSVSPASANYRLRMLMNLYNSLLSSGPRFNGFRLRLIERIIDVAQGNDLFHVILPYLAHLKFSDLDASVDQSVRLQFTIIKLLHGSSMRDLAAEYQTSLLRLISNSYDRNHAPVLAWMMTTALKDRDVFYYDKYLVDEPMLLGSIEKGEDAPVLAMIRALVTLKDVEETFQTHKAKLLTKGITEDCIFPKLRLLRLAHCVGPHTGERPLSELALATGICLGEVEDLVVEAVSLGLIRGRVNQLTGCVEVCAVGKRVIDNEDWAGLQRQLDRWLTSLKTVVTSGN